VKLFINNDFNKTPLLSYVQDIIIDLVINSMFHLLEARCVDFTIEKRF